MTGLCRDCKHYEPFERYWESEGRAWDSLEDFKESARYIREEHWKTRQWGRCLLTVTVSGSLLRPGSRAGAIDFEAYAAEVRCAPDYGCVMFEQKEEG